MCFKSIMQCQKSNVNCQMSNVNCGIGICQVSNVKCQKGEKIQSWMSDVISQMLNVKFQISDASRSCEISVDLVK